MATPVTAEESLLGILAGAIGATEPALRLLLSILVGYPLGLLHRHTLYGKSPALQHIFFIACGLTIGYFNYGWEVVHSLATVFGVYTILLFVGGSVLSVILVLIYTMGYLLIGYYVTGTETYDIKWSMPQCVLTLRLIGLSYDIYDGTRPESELSMDMKKTALKRTPSILEVAAHTYFPASFLVGPQFPMKRYLDFVEGRFQTEQDGGLLPDCLHAGFKRGCMGFFYLAVFQVGTSFFPDKYLLTPEYDGLPFYQRCFILGLWGKITLYKYISCWLISEGVCIVTGLTYNGQDSKGISKWDGCANVKMDVFEGATEFGHFITSFNINTNTWVAQYVYKRLKFLNNRYISQACALMFLAVWHGLHSGYYVCFLMEFMIMYLEKDLESIIRKNPCVGDFLNLPAVVPIKWIILKCYTFVFMGYCLVPFAMLSYNRWFSVYKSVYFIGHVVFGLWPIYSILIRAMLSCRKETAPGADAVARSASRAARRSSNSQAHPHVE